MHDVLMRVLWHEDGTSRVEELVAPLVFAAFFAAGAFWAGL